MKDVQDNSEGSKNRLGSSVPPFFSPIADLFSIDLRSLAFFRIGFGLVLLIDVLYRWKDINFFYTDDGAFPRMEALRHLSSYSFCYHLAAGNWEFQALTFLIAAIAHLCFIFGYKTRLAAILSWVHVLSIDRRNYQVLQGGDDLIRNMAFWAMFLPLGARWSLDSLLSGKIERKTKVVSVASVGALFQMAFVYIFTAILKSGDAWRVDGTAIQLALEIDQFTKPFGYFLLSFPGILKPMTLATWYLEMYGPFFAYIPLKNAFFRTLTAFTFIIFHFGLMLSMELGPFPYACMIGWCLYLPGAFWDKVFKGSAALGQALTPVAKPMMSLSGRILFCAREVFLGLLLVNVFLWNLRGTDFKRWEQIYPTDYNFICQGLGLDQYWAMFSPYPLTIDGWYIIVGATETRTVNLTPGSNPEDRITDEKPAKVAAMYQTERWRKYLMNMMFADNKSWRPLFVTALARKWNREHPNEKIKVIDIYYWTETTNLTGPPERKKDLLWHYDASLP